MSEIHPVIVGCKECNDNYADNDIDDDNNDNDEVCVIGYDDDHHEHMLSTTPSKTLRILFNLSSYLPLR